jgi:hypothetical protein
MHRTVVVLLVGLLLAAATLAGVALVHAEAPGASAYQAPGGSFVIEMQLDGDWLPAGQATTQATTRACIDGASAPGPLRLVHDGRVIYQRRPAGE